MASDDLGMREIMKVTRRNGELIAFLTSPDSLHMPHSTKSKNDQIPTEITLKHGEEFLNTGLFYGRIWGILLKPLTLSKTGIR